MTIFQQYQKHSRDFVYLIDIAKELISIFEGSGKSQILTNGLVSQYNKKIKDFLVLSNEMEQALNYLQSELRELLNDETKYSSSLFYFSQYGGSKTQFLNIALNEVKTTIPDCIVILFNDINDLNPIKLFEKIKQSTYFSIPKLSRFNDHEDYYLKLISRLENISAEINVDLRQSKNRNTLVEKIGFVKNRLSKNPQLREKLNDAIKLVHSSILVDSESVVKKILEFMRVLTEYGFIFLFLYDEVDLWIDNSQGQLLFSEKFNRLNRVMKLLFESHQEKIKMFYLFACTNRLNLLIKEHKFLFSDTSPVASRFIQIYDRSQPVIELGSYNQKIDEALAKISAYYSLSNKHFKIEKDYLDKCLDKLKEKYAHLSRRNTNSQVVKVLKVYNSLKPPLEKGMKEWISNPQKYGKLIEYHLDQILQQINIRFVREEILIDPEGRETKDKIDGYFVNIDENENEIKTPVEIKLTKNFKGDKAYQALQWTQVRKEKIVMLIFSPGSLDQIREEIIKFANRNGFTDDDTNKIEILLLSDPFSFSPIIGVENVSSDHSRLTQFYKDFAYWLDFFGNFSKKYHQLKKSLGLMFKRQKTPKPDVDGEDNGGKEPREEKKLPSEAIPCLSLLVKLYSSKKMKGSGRLAKGTLDKINKQYSLGISDMQSIIDILERFGIIVNVTKAMVDFTQDILKLESLSKFVELCEKKFLKTTIYQTIF